MDDDCVEGRYSGPLHEYCNLPLQCYFLCPVDGVAPDPTHRRNFWPDVYKLLVHTDYGATRDYWCRLCSCVMGSGGFSQLLEFTEEQQGRSD